MQNNFNVEGIVMMPVGPFKKDKLSGVVSDNIVYSPTFGNLNQVIGYVEDGIAYESECRDGKPERVIGFVRGFG
jgi:hypothetical protein